MINFRSLKRKFLNEESRLDSNDALSVSRLCAGRLQPDVVFYQELIKQERDPSKDQPLILVMQTEWQRKMLHMHGRMINYLDSTYGSVTIYGFALYVLSVQDSFGRGVPVSFIFLSEDTQHNLFTALSQLKKSMEKHGMNWRPR